MKAEAANLEEIVGDLLAVGRECEWVEFKLNNSQPTEIGEYLSALSNGACLSGQPYGWQVFGVNDKTLGIHEDLAATNTSLNEYTSFYVENGWGGTVNNVNLKTSTGKYVICWQNVMAADAVSPINNEQFKIIIP